MYKRYECLTLIFAMIIALSTLSSVAAAPRDEKTVLYMSFDEEPDGDFAEDKSGYENHGTIIGQGIEWFDDGKYAGMLEFDGASRIEIAHSDSLNMSEGITLEIWFRTEIPQKGRFLIYKMHNGGGRTYQWGIYLTGDSQNVSMYVVKPNDEVGLISHGGNYMDGEWHFLAGTYDGKQVVCFVDGAIKSVALTGEMRTGEAPVVIGTWSGNFFTGALDEARICNVPLTEEQLISDYENGYDFLAVDSTGKLSTTWGELKSE